LTHGTNVALHQPVQSLTPVVVLLAALLTADDQPTVPLQLEVELLGKVLRYDRNLALHTPTGVSVLVVHVDGEGSTAVARQLFEALGSQPTLGGLAHTEKRMLFSTPQALAAQVKEQGIDVVLFAPGLSNQAGELARALDGLEVLTVTTTASGVREGYVLGFELVAGRPHMLFNLAQARRQRTDFRAEVLQLMTVYP
jgi:YfiR/HmsC-like